MTWFTLAAVVILWAMVLYESIGRRKRAKDRDGRLEEVNEKLAFLERGEGGSESGAQRNGSLVPGEGSPEAEPERRPTLEMLDNALEDLDSRVCLLERRSEQVQAGLEPGVQEDELDRSGPPHTLVDPTDSTGLGQRLSPAVAETLGEGSMHADPPPVSSAPTVPDECSAHEALVSIARQLASEPVSDLAEWTRAHDLLMHDVLEKAGSKWTLVVLYYDAGLGLVVPAANRVIGGAEKWYPAYEMGSRLTHDAVVSFAEASRNDHGDWEVTGKGELRDSS